MVSFFKKRSKAPQNSAGQSSDYREQFNKHVKKTQRTMAAERLWPRLLPPLTGAGLFLTASWIGLWATMPPVAAAITVGTLLTGTAISPFLVKEKSPFVSRKEALKRLDESVSNDEKPARRLADKIAAGNTPEGEKLLKRQQQSLWTKWGNELLNAGKPVFKKTRARIAGLAVLAALTVSAAVTGFKAGDERGPLLKEAFNWSVPETPVAPLTVRAWVRPPENINARVIQLADTTKTPDGQADLMVIHPNSKMTIMAYGEPAAVLVNGEALKPENDEPANGAYEYRLEFDGEQTQIEIKQKDGRSVNWHVKSITDMKPAVKIDNVGTNENMPNRLKITTGAKDDFGIASGKAIITVPKDSIDPKATPLPSGQPKAITLPGIRYRR